MKHLVIVGPSCSGKSTIAKLIADKLTMPLVSLDDYYNRSSDPVYVMGADGEPYQTWERPHMYDGHLLMSDVHNDKGSYAFDSTAYIIEGFIALQYEGLRTLTLNSTRVYIDLSFNECLRRRKLRPRHAESDLSFAAIGERETKEFVEPQKRMENVVVLNGTAPVDQLVKEIIALYNE